MPDYFALLQEPRRPWLDAEILKTRFLTRSAAVHPDRVHEASEADKQVANHAYTELNAAYQCLREPRTRIRHLLELELGAKPSDLTDIPNDLMELFSTVGKVFREVDTLLAEKSGTNSPLLLVQLFERSQDLVEKLGGVRELILPRRDGLFRELKALDDAWAGVSPKPTQRLLEIWRVLSFYERWLAQIQERVVQLSF